jgi:DnaJ like chaperone protein
MGLTGVFLGALLGLAITRTAWGAVIGAIIGYVIEQHGRAAATQAASPAVIRTEFFRATFEVMGNLAKSDGHVSEAEIDAARLIMEEFSLSQHETAAAMSYFRAGKEPAFSPHPSIERLRNACGQRFHLLRLFLELQLRAALMGNGISPPVRTKLMQIAEMLGFSGLEFASMEGVVRARAQRQRSTDQKARSGLAECYEELGVEASVTNQELTKAYRRLLSRHHPDKLVANGLPESMAQMAKEKTQRIQEAYEEIRLARGMR